jgi:hypothetical protein
LTRFQSIARVEAAQGVVGLKRKVGFEGVVKCVERSGSRIYTGFLLLLRKSFGGVLELQNVEVEVEVEASRCAP